jgi:RNA-binding protein
MTPEERRKLKSLAHHLKPVLQVGQKGLTESLITAADQALEDHELIKIKFMDFKEDKREITDEIASRTGAETVTIIGNIAVLYRSNPDKSESKN